MGIWLVWSQVIIQSRRTEHERETRVKTSHAGFVSPHRAKMGSASSVVLPVAPDGPQRTATSPRTAHGAAPPTSVISERGIDAFERAFETDPQALLSQTVLSKTDFAAALVSRSVQIADQQGASSFLSQAAQR